MKRRNKQWMNKERRGGDEEKGGRGVKDDDEVSYIFCL